MRTESLLHFIQRIVNPLAQLSTAKKSSVRFTQNGSIEVARFN